jgi:hypothetical protein
MYGRVLRMINLTTSILIFLLTAMTAAFIVTHNNNMKLLDVTARLVKENDKLKKANDQNLLEFMWSLQSAQEKARLDGCHVAIQRLCMDSSFKDKAKCASIMEYVCQEI